MKVTLQVDGEAKNIQRPKGGIPFPVNPSGIDRKLFQEERKDPRQEETRKLILEAFAMVDEKPKKYGKSFKILRPWKTWSWKYFCDLIELANNLGDHIADWVEQALGWAQRISNGEPWRDICNKKDTARWFRLVKWKNGYYRLVGGSRGYYCNVPASNVSNQYYDFHCCGNYIEDAVPLVVLYDEQEVNPIQRPTEGIPFPVNPSGIDRKLFQEEREKSEQEKTRKLILEAFANVDEYPERYGKPFKTLMPKKTWERKDVSDLIEFANNLGDHEADWVEQALELAQRISNGESWEDICDTLDTARWFRLVKWKNGDYLRVGGSREFNNSYSASYFRYLNFYSASDVRKLGCNFDNEVTFTVPLVVLYK